MSRLIIPPPVPPRRLTPPTAADFHAQWETVQRRLGEVLMAYYHHPERYVDAVADAAYAVADLEQVAPTQEPAP